MAFTQHLSPDLSRAIDLEVLDKHTMDLRLEALIPLGPCAELVRISALGGLVVICGWRDRQDLASRFGRSARPHCDHYGH
jgi:hypothetical protein